MSKLGVHLYDIVNKMCRYVAVILYSENKFGLQVHYTVWEGVRHNCVIMCHYLDCIFL